MSAYMPVSDSEFMDWISQFLKRLEPLVSELELSEEDFEDLKLLNADFRTALVHHVRRQDEARAACTDKNESRKRLEAEVRRLARQADGHPSMNNSIRTGLGLRPKRSARPRKEIGQQSAGPKCEPVTVVAQGELAA